MFNLISKLAMGGALVATAFLAGCQAGEPSKLVDAGTPGAPALMCDKCQTVWVNTPRTTGPRGSVVTSYTMNKQMPCNECRSVATKWINGFKGSQIPVAFKHECSTCKGRMEICESH